MILLLGRLLNFDFSFRFEISLRLSGLQQRFLRYIHADAAENLNQIRLSKPVELLSGGNVGEREPKRMAAYAYRSYHAGRDIRLPTSWTRRLRRWGSFSSQSYWS